MKRPFLALLAACAVFAPGLSAHEPVTKARTPVNIPDVAGYLTLKCDFHIHTVFSDGLVWPNVRSDEAWREGLDAIAITDHIEYQPHKKDMVIDLNRSYEIAKAAGDDLKVLVVHGSEITRSMPPGHMNAIFLTNSTPLETKDWMDAHKAAQAQGAFVFWNHPGWERQITNGLVKWYPEHTQLLEAGMLHGIEVVNGRDYYPEAHKWAVEKKLAMLSNSDIHAPLNMDYHVHENNDHRPLTLVFAKERTIDSIREAMFARRTAVYSGNRLIGDERFLKPIFEKSVRFDHDAIRFLQKKKVTVQVSNDSDIDYELELVSAPEGFVAPKKTILAARKTVLMALESGFRPPGDTSGNALVYRVTNLLVGPDRPMEVTLPIKLQFGN
jgi:predicted metal-dependent phosphoesterase TrpH